MTTPLTQAQEQAIRERLEKLRDYESEAIASGTARPKVFAGTYTRDVQALLDENERLRRLLGGAQNHLGYSIEEWQAVEADRDRLAQRVSELEGLIEGFAIPMCEVLREKAVNDEARDVCDRVLVHLRQALSPTAGEGGG